MTPATPPPAWTVLTVLQWAHTYLQSKGISEPRPAAEVLLAHCLHCNRLDLYLRHDQPLSEPELACYKTLLKRRLAFEPTQYIIGRQEFWSLEFLVDPAVLIPRPETELLVEVILKQARSLEAPDAIRWILDLGTGSGILAVVLAKELPLARVLALDRSLPALGVARKNVRRHGVEAQVSLVCGDLAQALRPQTGFDVIVANLPYVPTPEWERLPPEIKGHEPRTALDGGFDGLDYIRPLIQTAPALLQPGGLLALEVGQGQAAAVARLLADQKSLEPAAIIADYQRIDRILAARKQA